MLFSETRIPNFGYIAADPNARLDPNVMIRGSYNFFYRGDGICSLKCDVGTGNLAMRIRSLLARDVQSIAGNVSVTEGHAGRKVNGLMLRENHP